MCNNPWSVEIFLSQVCVVSTDSGANNADLHLIGNEWSLELKAQSKCQEEEWGKKLTVFSYKPVTDLLWLFLYNSSASQKNNDF